MTKQEKQQHTHSCLTRHDHIMLTWKSTYKWTILFDKNNVGTFYLAPRYTNFAAFSTKAQVDLAQEDAHPIHLTKGGEHPDVLGLPKYTESPPKSTLVPVDFDLQGPHKSDMTFTHELNQVKPDDAAA